MAVLVLPFEAENLGGPHLPWVDDSWMAHFGAVFQVQPTKEVGLASIVAVDVAHPPVVAAADDTIAAAADGSETAVQAEAKVAAEAAEEQHLKLQV